MKNKNKKNNSNIKFPRKTLIVFTGAFLVLILRLLYLGMANKVEGINLSQFGKNRTERTKVIRAHRGTIYDRHGEALAISVSSYDLIAHLDEKRTTNKKFPKHVDNIEEASVKLSAYLNAPKDYIYERLNKKKDGLKQTAFGKYGKNLSEMEKDQIKALEIPGLEFIPKSNRYYPYGNFLSYTIGFSNIKYNKDLKRDVIKGMMGIEAAFDNDLSGSDGYTSYIKDNRGYKIPGSKEVVKKVKHGSDIYLTIDSKIQLFVEQAFSDALKENKWDSATMIVADAKSGEILAMASNPAFDPNKRDIKNYKNPAISEAYEPGSTMKIFSYMAAMENGSYNGSSTYKSGTYVAKDGTVMGDWNDKKGWGNITYDAGFALSSNTAVMNLVKNGLGGTRLKNYYKALGFGSKTNIKLANEVSGLVNFRYETEVLNAAFGQGILTTPIQNVKALTPLANDGNLLSPYIVKKVKYSNKIIYEGKKTSLGKVASSETISKMKKLMASVIEGNASNSTGYIYKMDGYDLIGKTGTAQVSDKKGYGKNTIRALSALYPKENPQIIIYLAVKNPKSLSGKAPTNAMTHIVKDVVTNTSNHLNIFNPHKNELIKSFNINVKSYINKDKETAILDLDALNVKYVILGNGNKIINQYPKNNQLMNNLDTLYLLTDGDEIKMPNLLNLSFLSVKEISKLLPSIIEINGEGYVVSQSVMPGTLLQKEDHIKLSLNSIIQKSKEDLNNQ